MKTIRWNHDKNEKLSTSVRSRSKRSFITSTGDIVDITQHPNPRSTQQVYVIRLRGYLHLVPFIETADEIFLKTIIPSRRAEREYRHV